MLPRRLQTGSRFCPATIAVLVLTTLASGCSVDVQQDAGFPKIPALPAGEVPDSLMSLLRVDANRLAVRHMQKNGIDEVHIPQDLSSSLLNALASIVSARDLPARDSVVDQFRIRTFPNPSLHEIILNGLNPSCEWAARLKSGQIPVGQPAVDSLMAEHALSFVYVFGPPGSSQFALLRSSLPLNTQELARRFSGIDCLTGAEPNGSCCDGDDILAVAEADAWLFSFQLGWGDCPAGCIANHYWDFRVSSDGVVRFVGSRGDTVPDVDQRSWRY